MAVVFVLQSKDYGIYYATQDTSDGLDYFYFIGTPNSIIEKLNLAWAKS